MGTLRERVMWSSQTRVCLFYLASLLYIYQGSCISYHTKSNVNMNLKVYGKLLCESVNCTKKMPIPAERNKRDREEHSGPWRSEVKRNKIVRMMKRGGGKYYDLKIYQNPLRRIF